MNLPQITLTRSGIEIIVTNPTMNNIVRMAVLADYENANYYLGLILVLLICLCFKQIHAFSRPPPVQRKKLPRRPALQIMFKPDGISSAQTFGVRQKDHDQQYDDYEGENEMEMEMAQDLHDDKSINPSIPTVVVSDQPHSDETYASPPTQSYTSEPSRSKRSKKPTITPHDLPDGFAPLLSSSQMEILYEELSTDLLHAVQAEASIRLRHGRHEIPLDKDNSRPQLILDIPKEGIKVTAMAAIGSDGLSTSDDLDPAQKTVDRSLPMVKHAGVTLDPPLPLVNVAPTLIHFPTLFEDNVVKYTLRRIQIVRYGLDLLKSISSFIEKILWIVESKCQIHLGKVSVTPLYKGAERSVDNRSGGDAAFCEPQWRLSLSFSGHVVLFGFLPIPFVNITLPTWIIPQPHALLEYLASSQPLASAKVKKERIAEERVTLAVIDTVDSWDVNMEAVATPPALSVDLAMSGGITVAVEAMHGTDVSGGRPRGGVESGAGVNGRGMVESTSNEDTLSSCTMFSENDARARFRRHRGKSYGHGHHQNGHPSKSKVFDANDLVPWKFNVAVRGKVDKDQISVMCSQLSATHDPSAVQMYSPGYTGSTGTGSKVSLSGNFVLWKPDAAAYEKAACHGHNFGGRKISATQLQNLALEAQQKSIAAILLFPKKRNSSTFVNNQRYQNLLQYDYNLNIGEDTSLDAVSLSVGATHPMLKGGTIITTILESIYSYGSLFAREGSIVDMSELGRKRNILKHLPAIDLTAGIQHIFIPEESMSFSDDGQTRCIPELLGGQMMLRLVGGLQGVEVEGFNRDDGSTAVSSLSSKKMNSSRREVDAVLDGIKLTVDLGVGSFAINNKTKVNEFPELDIFDDQKLVSTLAGSIDGTIGFHLRPQKAENEASKSLSKNVFNPLEAYEIDFSNSNVRMKISEANATLGHRRLIIPSETCFGVNIVNSVVDMAFDGETKCEFNWDFQGSSPILQSVAVGSDPLSASHEEKEQVKMLIYSLRQGRFNLNVSSVGGLTITQAATSRENKDGLYDWKFFNAIVSPSDESAGHILKVLHDKRTMGKLMQVVKLISKDLEKVASYLLEQVWRAKNIFDAEGVSDPGHAIPGHKMARLLSLFLCGDADQINEILPVVRRVVAGDGLDVLKTKELIRKNLSFYEDYAPEIDRATRWAEVMLGSIEAPKPFVEKLSPVSEIPQYKALFDGFPSAKELYSTLLEKSHLPLDPSFSAMVSTLAPYMSFPQVEYVLHARPSNAWQPGDLRRIRYVYTVKKKVLEISESYGGLSFMPQSFFVSVFVGEATRASLRASDKRRMFLQNDMQTPASPDRASNESALHALRNRQDFRSNEDLHRLSTLVEGAELGSDFLSPAGRIASMNDIANQVKVRSVQSSSRSVRTLRSRSSYNEMKESFDPGDSLLGPGDVAILLQAGLTSAMRGSTVVQLNQRMLLDLMASQPRHFSVAVLCEIGSPGGQGSPRGLTSALMALLDLDQSSFTEFHRVDMHQLLESWLPGLKIPRRENYLAGGRWASRSYYDAIFNVAESILEEAEVYTAFKGHIQRVRHCDESEPVPTAKEAELPKKEDNSTASYRDFSTLRSSIESAKSSIEKADKEGQKALNSMQMTGNGTKDCEICQAAIHLYNEAFAACKKVMKLDKLAFHADWFKSFYRRNYDALMVKSLYENILDDTDEVREWFSRLYKATSPDISSSLEVKHNDSDDERNGSFVIDFMNPENHSEQMLLDAIIDLIFYEKDEKTFIKHDPLVRLLISNPDGNYNFSIVSAMGVITEGKRGVELEAALQRLKEKRNVQTIRADTGTARSLEYNASQIHDAIDEVVALQKPYGLLGYSQGCPNTLMAESLLLSGSPTQQEKLRHSNGSQLVCRQLLFSAANGSMHGPAMEAKIHRLIVMCESFFKYQQGYFSRALIETVLDALNNLMDSAPFQKFVAGGGGTFLHVGCRAFWREAQHLPQVPTCVLRGVLEEHTTPESLEMISNLLTKAGGSHLHDSQVHVYDAVGRPVYTKNRNAKVLENCEMGGAVQRTHHWSPLNEEVKFVSTPKDEDFGTFLCAKDRHVFPWVDVNARFGFIDYESSPPTEEGTE